MKSLLRVPKMLFSQGKFVKFSEQTPEYKQKQIQSFNKEIELMYGDMKLWSAFKDCSYGENVTRKMRRDYLNRDLTRCEKIPMPVLRMRTEKDTLTSLFRSRKETPAVIQAREEFPELDIVISRKWLTHRKK